MADDSIIPRVRRLIEEDGAYLLPNKSVHPNKLSTGGAVEADVVTIVDGRATWAAPTGGGGADLSDDDPVMDGTAYEGVSTEASRSDHVHPTDTTRASDAELAAEAATRASDDTTLQTNLTAEAATRALADLQLRQDADDLRDEYEGHGHSQYATDTELSALQSEVDAHESLTTSAHGGFYSVAATDALIAGRASDAELDAEIATRAAADTTLQTNIDTQQAARVLGDAALQQGVEDLQDVVETHSHDDRYYIKAVLDALLATYLTIASAASTYATAANLAITQAEVDGEEAARALAVVQLQQTGDDLRDEFDSHKHNLSDIGLPNAAVPMNNQKMTGLAAATVAGDSLRYEQLFTTGTVTLLGSLTLGAAGALSLSDGGGSKAFYGTAAAFQMTDSGTSLQSQIIPGVLKFGTNSVVDTLLTRTAASEVTLTDGASGAAVFKHATPAENDASTKSATTAYVDRATGNASSNRPVGRMARAADLSVVKLAWTAITFDTELTDTDGMVTIASTPTKLTCTTAGEYDFFGAATIQAGGSGGVRGARLRRYNSAGTSQEIAAPLLVPPITSTVGELVTSATFNMAAGDYVVLEIYHDHSASLNVTVGSGTYASTLSGSWTGGTGAAWGNAGARVVNTALQTIGNAGWTNLTFNTERWDIDGMASLGTNNDRLTCVTPGTYIVTAHSAFVLNGTGIRGLKIDHYNSSNVLQETYNAWVDITHAANIFDLPTVSEAVQMQTGDYVRASVYQSSGGNLNTSNGSSTYYASLSALRVGYQTNPQKDGQFIGSSAVTASGAHLFAGAGTTSALDTNSLALTVAGDGVNYVRLAMNLYGPYLSAGTTSHFDVGIYDSTAGAMVKKQQLYISGATPSHSGGPVHIEALVAPFAGSKTFTLVFTSGAAQTVTNQAGAGFASTLSAYWAGSTSRTAG